ncbi:hypothetical protein FIBSPDRAFT_888999 [Athelia psychrophila]|uniref:Carbamoyl-phosphate synthetase large subunit-like ATP-binding domain-containing protein n=1 Tax=Athelia psychrophila TaxID=1759441 RepID=A0A166MSS5_9AGAM|nr:hypothetical protein FIBSPDRAFT_888999 [Fibularhizoctonia sp. CBS 109695]
MHQNITLYQAKAQSKINNMCQTFQRDSGEQIDGNRSGLDPSGGEDDDGVDRIHSPVLYPTILEIPCLFVDHREISIRILRTAQELRWSAVAVYIAQGIKNATLADKAVKLHDRSWFTKPERIPHPAKSALRGGQDALQSAADIHAFVEQGQKSGDDQGAGRGTRSISAQQRVEEAFKRFVTLFRYYLVQTAPSTITSNLAQLLPAASTTMAGALRYQGVGAFACLVNSHTGDWVLLEINPRYAGRAWCLHRAARRARRHTSMRRSAVRVCEVQCVGTDSDSNILVRGRGLGEATQQSVLALREPSAGQRRAEEGEYDVVGARADECDDEWDGPAQAVGGRIGFARTARRDGGDRHLDLSIGVRIADNEARNDISPRPIQSRRRQEEAHPEAHLHRAQHLYPPPLRHAPNRHLPAPLAFSLKQVQPSAGVCAGTFDLAEHSDNYRAELHPAVLAESGIVAKRDTIAMLSVIKMESMWWRRALGVVRRGKSVDVGVVAGEEMLLQLAVVALWMRS